MFILELIEQLKLNSNLQILCDFECLSQNLYDNNFSFDLYLSKKARHFNVTMIICQKFLK